MMRYQRVSPDVLPLTNGAKKPYLRPSPSRSSPHEDTTTTITPNSISGKGFNGGSCTSLDGVRIRSSQQTDPTPTKRGGDVLLQWGQRKRSRVSRAEIRSSTTTATAAADDSSSSSGHGKIQSNKLLRRSVNPSMPPPPPPPHHPVSSNRNSNHRNGFVGSKEIFLSRNQEDRSASGSPSRTINNGRTVSRSGGSKRSPPSPDQIEKRSSLRDHHHQNQRQNGFDHNHNQHHQRVNRSESTAQAHPELETNNNGEREKATQVEVTEWPRIYIALSRKEKEEDFLVMKGTKLPHRPRKRAKNIDKSLQFCFPGLWLSDLPKNRYDVREKKNVKKQQQKRRGLKGMEDLDTDSE
ncbi:serine/threonine-protein kinase pakA isoform X1 [Brassica napus]|nr:serine/threonine-protein kinase pakA isoform X1 [Brassica napus]